MIDNLDTLLALEKHGTMSKAATFLRISQSAVSKRIATLETHIGKKLIEKDGRKVILTPKAISLLDKVRPLISELKFSMTSELVDKKINIQLGVSESILSSWGASSLKKVKKKFCESKIIPHTHRSPVVIDKVRSGEYMIGLCAGTCAKASDLQVDTVGEEKFVLIRANNDEKDLMTIEDSSETWQVISRQVKQLNLNINARLESFFAIAQLANAGIVDGLVPEGVANYLSIPKNKIEHIEIRRPIIMIGRKSTLQRSGVNELYESFKEIIKSELK